MTYTNNDYGKGLADSIESNYTNAGGKVTISTPHEDGKGDYGAEVGALAQAGGDILVVAGYLDQGGKGIIQSSLDSGAFDHFFFTGCNDRRELNVCNRGRPQWIYWNRSGYRQFWL
jgi:branched-chain amino acid transport system substrate-binding protein